MTNTEQQPTAITMYASRMMTLATIKALPIDRLNERQPLLVDLLVSIVNYETANGSDTDGDLYVSSQGYWKTLLSAAKDCGFEFLGNGFFSAAFKHEMLPQKVIKIGFKKEDSGAAYAAWCRMNQGRIGVPVIHGIARHAGCYSVVLDELTTQAYGDRSKAMQQYNLALSTIGGTDVDFWDDFSMDLKQTVHDIRAFFKDIASFDLHIGNVMVDRNGNIVITDPVSYTHGLERDEFKVDAEELLCEIEALAMKRVVERCKRRKARRVQLASTEFKAKGKRLRKRKAVRKARLAKIDLGELDVPDILPLIDPRGRIFHSGLQPANIVHALDARPANKFIQYKLRGRRIVPMFEHDFGRLEMQARQFFVADSLRWKMPKEGLLVDPRGRMFDLEMLKEPQPPRGLTKAPNWIHQGVRNMRAKVARWIDIH